MYVCMYVCVYSSVSVYIYRPRIWVHRDQLRTNAGSHEGRAREGGTEHNGETVERPGAGAFENTTYKARRVQGRGPGCAGRCAGRGAGRGAAAVGPRAPAPCTPALGSRSCCRHTLAPARTRARSGRPGASRCRYRRCRAPRPAAAGRSGGRGRVGPAGRGRRLRRRCR
jgi:hypothetical protein